MCVCVCARMCVCVCVCVCVKSSRISSRDPSVVCEKVFVGLSTLRDEFAYLVEACCSISGYYPEHARERQSWHHLLLTLL